MIEYLDTSLLTSKADAWVNCTNCVGLMGRGLGLQLRNYLRREYHAAFASECLMGNIRLSRMDIWWNGANRTPNWVINFPVIQHHQDKARIDNVRDGLVDLVSVCKNIKPRALAMPLPGVDYGDLPAEEVEELVWDAFEQVPWLNVELYIPKEVNSEQRVVLC